MASSHDAHGDHHHAPGQPHPGVPTITDEAPDTANWLPIAGLVVFTVFALFGLVRSRMAAAEAGAPAVVAEVAEVAPSE